MATIAEMLALALRHQRAGQLADAERLYRQILQVDPAHADAAHQLGRMAMVAGQHAAAIELIATAVRAQRNTAAFHASLGEAQRRAGQSSEASASFRRALQLDPQLAAAHTNLGILLHQTGQVAEAAECFRQATRLHPQDPQAFANLGRAQYDLGRMADAEHCFRRAAMLTPNNPRGHYNLGSVLQAQGKYDEACDCYRAALALKDDEAEAHNNFGILLKELNRPAEAERHYRRAIEIQPSYAAAYNNLAVVLGDQERHDEAVAAGRRAIELAPELGEAYGNLAGLLHGLGRLDESLALYRKAITLRPADANLHSNLLYVMNYHPGLDAATIWQEHRSWGAKHADPLTAQSPPLPLASGATNRRLCIGYVSAYFKHHAVNFFVEPILAAHDRTQFEIFCYSDVVAPDATTERLRGYVDAWRRIVELNDQQLAELVRQDGIDVLVDLTGHIFGGHRLLAFARRAAPVQVTYIGYQNTTGMQAMDYRLTDDWSDPPGTTEPFYTETLWRLPRSFFCYQPSAAAPPIGPVAHSLAKRVTFASVNNFAKVTPQVLAAWGTILRQVRDSRLLLLAPQAESLRHYVRQQIERAGARPDAVEFVGRRSHEQYLQLLAQVDIALDPFPFNGHTTTCDCLWMGVPVVMQAGHMYASRFGGSALMNLGCQELIAANTEQYIEIASGLAADSARLERLHHELRPRMSESVLVDGPGFTRNLEAAYQEMWARRKAAGR